MISIRQCAPNPILKWSGVDSDCVVELETDGHWSLWKFGPCLFMISKVALIYLLNLPIQSLVEWLDKNGGDFGV